MKFIQVGMKKDEIFKKLREKNTGSIVPIFSGGAALYLLNRLLFSDLPEWQYKTGIISILSTFTVSAYLFWKLKWLEREKDQYLLSTVGKIVEDVFRHYGVAMASNAAGPTTAKQMNPIMQTIVNLVRSLKGLIDKTYTKN
ncbi:hypothetical protein A3B46_03260 [Candidatus Roizmanbacteria bacterium RIFCSPLOWO2_01_FULL_39_19]|nr:MAG: hypothetical protein A3B46_03260 [Candidatus Roizmanbacteria bacterium RIFCSPLOWO2_01_FULL_39_19]